MEILWGTLAYTAITFPYALLWHMKVFRKKYEAWHYFGANPKPILALFAILFQGALLSYGYQWIQPGPAPLLYGLCYALGMGAFFWTCHVLSYMAKHQETRNLGFMSLESLYLIGQFGLFGLAIGLIHKSLF